MGNARQLAEFNQSGWIQVDFAPLINYRRKEERRHVTKLVEDIFDQEMSGELIQNIFEEEREEDDEGWINQFNNSKICNEEREEYNRDEPSDLKEIWEKIGLKLKGYRLCAIEAYTLANQDMEVLKDEEKSESTKSDLDDMWYTGDKESNIQDFEDEDLVDIEDFKEDMNAYIVEGLRVPHAELKKLHDSDEEATTLVVVWTSLGPLPRWVPGPTTRWAPGTTRLALHGT
jgi:hypothetical protein